MFYYLYEYLSWYFSTQEVDNVKVESPSTEEIKKEEELPPVNIASLETEQEDKITNINPVYSYLIYPKRTRSRRV